MAEKKYAVPRFSKHWTKMGVPERVGLWDGKPWADVQTQGDPREPASWDRARRSRPTIWAHPAAFYDSLRRKTRAQPSFDSREFQLWGGLLAALYKGDLEQVEVDPAMIDPDLPAAFREGLPIDPADWPREVSGLHDGGQVTVFRSSLDPRPVAIGYAPSILVPALWLWEDELAGHGELASFRFDDRMDPYAELEGYSQGFALALSELVDRVWPDHWFHGLLVSLRDVVKQWTREELPAETLATYRSEAATPLGYRWGGQVTPAKGDVWEHYPLRVASSAAAASEQYLVFVPDHGLEASLNPWLEELAFPGSGDTDTKIGDLQITPGGDAAVLGPNGQGIPLPAAHRVISLNPRARHDVPRLLRPELVHLVGQGACLDSDAPLDPVHDEIRGAVAKGHAATSLLPIDGAFLARHPELREGIVRSFTVRSGVALPEASATSEVRIVLPASRELEVVWQPNNVLVDGVEGTDTTPTVDLWPNFRTEPADSWRLYLLRIRQATNAFRFSFPELDPARQRSWDGYDPLVLVHDRPPTLAELADAADPDNSHGTLVLDPRGKLDSITTDPNKVTSVAIDFGTTNTSVAFKASSHDPPEVLEFHQRTWSLLRPKDPQKASPVPGWVFDEERHRGFFSTAIGVRELFKQDDPPCHQQIRDGDVDASLLETILNATELSGLKLEWLANVQDSAAARGKWEFHDQLKWGTDAENDRFRLTLRSCFMVHLFLHVAAEVQAQTGAAPRDWFFTHPLSMRWVQVESYESDMRKMVKQVLGLTSPGVKDPRVALQDESRAIFGGFIQSWGKKRFPSGQRVVIADMGGGSVDYAVFGERDHQPELIRSDSLRLAGQHFFQFTKDMAADSKALAGALEIHFGERSPNAVSRIGDPGDGFRKAFNWTLGSSMADKAGGDASTLQSNLRQLAEERAPLRDTDHLAIWLARLTRAVIGHAVLLGSAPSESENEKVSDLEIVLAGNGWGLLPYSGHQLGDEADLDGVANRSLTLLKEIWALRGSSFKGPGSVKVRALERAVGGLSEGVYSKDLVALGALAGERGEGSSSSEPQVVSSGILGADLALSTASNGDGGAEARIPWFSTSLPDMSRVTLGSLEKASGSSFFESHSVTGGKWSLQPEPYVEGSGESEVEFRIHEQLYMYALLDPKNEYPQGRTRVQVEDWNGEFEERARAWLEQVNSGATSTDYDRTSLVRGLWEYYFDHRIRQHLSRKS